MTKRETEIANVLWSAMEIKNVSPCRYENTDSGKLDFIEAWENVANELYPAGCLCFTPRSLAEEDHETAIKVARSEAEEEWRLCWIEVE